MRTIVITGVSRGLGAALFDQLAARGDRVFAIGRSFTDAQRALAEAEPERIVLRGADLATPDQVPGPDELAGVLRDAAEAVLLHNAAVIEPIGAVGALPRDQVAAAVTTNLAAPLVLTDAFLAALPGDARATILFVSSGAAHRVIVGWSVYSATKRGGEMFFEALAEQLRDDERFTVASVNPGVMDTGMQAAIRDSDFPDRERFVALHRHGDLPDPAEVASKIIESMLTTG